MCRPTACVYVEATYNNGITDYHTIPTPRTITTSRQFLNDGTILPTQLKRMTYDDHGDDDEHKEGNMLIMSTTTSHHETGRVTTIVEIARTVTT